MSRSRRTSPSGTTRFPTARTVSKFAPPPPMPPPGKGSHHTERVPLARALLAPGAQQTRAKPASWRAAETVPAGVGRGRPRRGENLDPLGHGTRTKDVWTAAPRTGATDSMGLRVRLRRRGRGSAHVSARTPHVLDRVKTPFCVGERRWERLGTRPPAYARATPRKKSPPME